MKSEEAASFESIDLDLVAMQLKAKNEKAANKLVKTTLVCGVFMVLQFIGGILANSIAIMSDAAHLLSDFSGFLISLFAIWMSQRPASGVMSFGYHRAEIVGALCSVILIWGLTFWLVYEAILRVIYPTEIEGMIMMITAAIGLGFNLILGTFLHSHPHGHAHGHGHDHDHEHEHEHEHRHKHKHKVKRKTSLMKELPSKYHRAADLDAELVKPFLSDMEPKAETENPDLGERFDPEREEERPSRREAVKTVREQEGKEANVNVRAAMIHVIGDIIQSVGVLTAAVIIYFWPSLTICDPICTFIFSIIVMFTTIPIVKDCVVVLMEGSPQDIDTERIVDDINKIEGIEGMHDLHVWSLSLGKPALSVHLTSNKPDDALAKATRLIKNKYQIFHSTIQVESDTQPYKCANILH